MQKLNIYDLTPVVPDTEFISDVMKCGGESVKKCYQCATCSVVCELAPQNKPFPRKEMIWTQWGLKEKLLSDKHVWLCHQCNDCTVHCPRDARPGDVLAAIRSLSIRHYAVPRFMARIVQQPAWIPVALLIPILFVLMIVGVDGHLGTLVSPPPGEVHFADHFLSHLVLNLTFGGAFTLFIILGLVGVARFWKDMNKFEPLDEGKGPGMIGAMVAAFMDLLAHRKFGKCTAAKTRYLEHMGVFYGFMILFAVTGVVVIMILLSPDSYPIMSLAHPLKIAGNVGAILFVVGCGLAIGSRLLDAKKAGQSHYFDWFFLTVLSAVGLTGILTQAGRFAEANSWSYWMYFVHLVFVFALLCYLPYSKFGHLLYRYFAMVHARRSGGYPE